MAKWRKKLRFWRNDAHLACSTGGTVSGEGHSAQPKPNLVDRVPNDTSNAAQAEESAFGIKLLVLGENPTIDIVAVHGLDGHREESWTADNGVIWLQALLPAEIPNARVLTYGYDSQTRSSEHLTHQTLYGHSMSLISALSLYRRRTKSNKTERHPIIFLAHSLGGIVLKSALIHSNMADVSHKEHLKAIKLSTYGVMFFGTPHQGTDSASWGKVLVNVASLFQHTSTALLKHLERDSEWLEVQLEQYSSISSEIFTIFCFESYPTPLPAGRSMIMVPKASAVVPGMRDAESLEIRKDHTTLVKFRNSSDNDFQTVVGHLSLMYSKAEEKVAQNWKHWEEFKAIISGTALLVTGDEHNKHFTIGVGATKNYVERPELENCLDKKLVVRSSTARDTSRRVVLYGLGGMGKTTTAVQYALRHRNDYFAVFWVDGSDETHMRRGYIEIAEQLNIDEPEDQQKSISNARIWLSKHQDWLLIIDNIDDDSTIELLRGGNLLNPAMRGHVLLTSRNQSLTKWYDPVEVSEVKLSEGKQFLAKILPMRIPITDEADGLLKDLGFLPLAIEQAAFFILETGITVEGYREEFSRQKEQLLGYYPDSKESVMTTWNISFKHVKLLDPLASKLFLTFSLLHNEDIAEPIWTSSFQGQRHWAPNGNFEVLQDTNDHWVPQDMKQLFCPEDGKSKFRLWKAIAVLKKFSLLREPECHKSGQHNPEQVSFNLHPLVHFWASKYLERDSELERELKICAIGLVASAFAKQDLLPPLLPRTHYWSDPEEKTAGMWPLRQYLQLTSHALRCLDHAHSVQSLPETVAHFSLALLQVLEYSTLGDSRSDLSFSLDLINGLEARTTLNSDSFLKYAIAMWRLTRRALCNCRVVQGRTFIAATPPCHTCQSAYEETIFLIPAQAGETIRVKVARLALIAKLYVDPFYNIAGIKGSSPNVSLKRIIETIPAPRYSASWLEQYGFALVSYFRNSDTMTWGQFGSTHSLDETEKNVSDFEALCGINSEEYRGALWNLTDIMVHDKKWLAVEDALKPLINSTLEYPTHRWSHERCLIRYREALREQGKYDEADTFVERVKEAYSKTDKQLRAFEDTSAKMSKPKKGVERLLKEVRKYSRGENDAKTLDNCDGDVTSIQVFIKTLEGKSVTISIDRAATVRKLCDHFNDKMGYSSEQERWQARLIYGGKQLDPARCLSDYNIQHEATLHHVLRLQGGLWSLVVYS